MINAFLGGVVLGIVIASVAIAIVAMVGAHIDERRKP